MKMLIVCFVLITTNLFSASFDCLNASNKTEKTICKNDVLSGWDEFFVRIYDYANEQDSDKNTLATEHLAWLQKRNECVHDRKCIEDAYTDRIQELIDRYVGQQSLPDEHIFQLVHDYPIKDCSNIKRYKGNDLDKEKTEEVRQWCHYIEKSFWNEASIRNVEIVQPKIKAKFFKDAKYQAFLKKAIEKAPKLKTELLYSNYDVRNARGTRFVHQYNQVKDQLEEDNLWAARDVTGLANIGLNLCDIRVYEGEFDGNSHNGNEHIVFSGMSMDPKYLRVVSQGTLKSYNFLDNTQSLDIYQRSDNHQYLISATTRTCLEYDESFINYKGKNFGAPQSGFLVLKSIHNRYFISYIAFEKYGELYLQFYDNILEKHKELILHKNGGVK